MRAILVSVDYADLLYHTLPYNRHHFEDVMVVTSTTDTQSATIAKSNHCKVFKTDAFWDDGADFNKWKALEQGLDYYGRKGLMCLMDADVVWPKSIPNWTPIKDRLYTPLSYTIPMRDLPDSIIPPEDLWGRYRERSNLTEWAGYTQIFYTDDRHLPTPPWHQTNWRHAGGADSFFQSMWKAPHKLRPPFEVLHLGESGKNWCGRVTNYVSGDCPREAMERADKLRTYLRQRRRTIRELRKLTTKTYRHERIFDDQQD